MKKGEAPLKGDPPFGLAVLLILLIFEKKAHLWVLNVLLCSCSTAYFHPPPRERYNSTTAPN